MSLLLDEIGDQTDGLDSLSETHFVCEDTVQIVVVQGYHPLQTLQLVLLQGTSNQVGSLLCNLFLDAVSNLVVVGLLLAWAVFIARFGIALLFRLLRLV